VSASTRKAYFQVEAEIVIDASAAQVWTVLVDLAHYSDWNSFVYSMKSGLKVGDTLTMKVRMRPRWGWNVVTIEEVTQVERQRRLGWRTLSPSWLLQGERFQTLEPIDANHTRYYTSEAFSGILAPLLKLLLGQDLQRGFESVARDLKQRVETLSAS
jgi:hypothetical protein